MADHVYTRGQTARQSFKIAHRHIQTTPTRHRRQLCCWTACGQKFASQTELSSHVNDHHIRPECPSLEFQCHWQGCPRRGRGFNARYKMLIHIRTHTNEKPHMCGVCGKSFSRLENLKIHTRSHTGERPYRCTFPGCSKAYSNSSDRFKHIRTHEELKPYKCKMPGCRKQYTDPSSLRKHVRTHRHTLDSSRRALYPSQRTETTCSDLKMGKDCRSSRDVIYNQDDTRDSYTDLVATPQFFKQHPHMDSRINIAKPSPFPKKKNKTMSYTELEPTLESPSPMLTYPDSNEERILKKEYNVENKMDSVHGDHQDVDKSSLQLETSITSCQFALSVHDHPDTISSHDCIHDSNNCHKTTGVSPFLSSSPVFTQHGHPKSVKLEHWKKRKLLISEKELQLSPQAARSPTSHQPLRSTPSHVSPNSQSGHELPVHSATSPEVSSITSAVLVPLINSHSPPPCSQVSSTLCFTNPPAPFGHSTTQQTAMCDPSTVTSQSSSLGQTGIIRQHSSPHYPSPLFSNLYSSIQTLPLPPSFCTPNVPWNPLLPGSNPSHFENFHHRYVALNPAWSLPAGLVFPHSEFQQPEPKHAGDQAEGLNILPLLMNLGNASCLTTTAGWHHCTHRVGFGYEDPSVVLPLFYQCQ